MLKVLRVLEVLTVLVLRVLRVPRVHREPWHAHTLSPFGTLGTSTVSPVGTRSTLGTLATSTVSPFGTLGTSTVSPLGTLSTIGTLATSTVSPVGTRSTLSGNRLESGGEEDRGQGDTCVQKNGLAARRSYCGRQARFVVRSALRYFFLPLSLSFAGAAPFISIFEIVMLSPFISPESATLWPSWSLRPAKSWLAIW